MTARAVAFWLKIEGCGDVTSGRCWRFASQIPSGDSDSVYLPHLGSPPWDPITATWDPRAQGAGAFSIGGVTARLLGSPEVLTRLYQLSPPTRYGTLNATITSSATTLTLRQRADVDLSGTAVTLGREVVRLDSRTVHAHPLHTYSVTRGLYETRAVAHTVAPDRDGSAFPADVFPIKLFRTVTVGMTPVDGSGYSSEVVLGRAVLSAMEMGGVGQWLSLTCDSALEVVRRVKLCGSLWRGQQTRRSEPLTDAGGWVVEWSGLDPRALPSYKTGVGLWRVGERVVLEDWSAYTPVSGDDVGATVQITDGAAPGPLSAPTSWDDAQGASELWEVFTTNPSSPALNNDATATQARLSTNPVALARQLLTTSRSALYASAGDNGDYDTGVAQLGCGVPQDLLDTATWDAAEDAGGPLCPSVWLGLDGEPHEALDTVQRILGYAGWAMVQTAAGLLTLRRLVTAAATPTITLTGAHQAQLTYDRPRLEDPLDELVVTWGRVPAGERVRTYRDAASTDRQLGQGVQGSLDLAGVDDEREAQSQALRTVKLWRWPMREVGCTILLTSDAQGLSVGDTALLSGLEVLSGAGARGGSALAQILSVTHRWGDGECDLTLLLVGLIQPNARRIAPSALVTSVASLVVTLEANTYTPTLAPGQTNDAFGWAVGDVVQISTRDGSTIRGTATITAVTPATPSIALDAVPGGTTAGDLIEPADYDDASAAQVAAWAYLADSADTLGTAADPAHEWTA